MTRTALWTVLTLSGFLSCSPAFAAAQVEGYGSISTNLTIPYTQIDTAYQNPVFLDVGKSVQLPPNLIGGGDKVLTYQGQAQFGRLGVYSRIGGQVPPAASGLSTGVDFYLGFQDQITPQNLNSPTGNYLRLDVGLSGEMTGHGATDNGNSIGKLTSARFEMTMLSLDFNESTNVSFVEFAWFGTNFFINNTTDGVGGTAGFVPYAGEEPAFTQRLTPGPEGYFFGTRGYVDIPLDDTLGLFGPSFLLSVSAAAHSNCGNEVPDCLAVTDFGSTALIGNARIVDGLGDPIPGAIFASASGYDYITPPGPLTTAVPEPETYALLLAGLGLLGFAARRRKQQAVSRIIGLNYVGGKNHQSVGQQGAMGGRALQS